MTGIVEACAGALRPGRRSALTVYVHRDGKRVARQRVLTVWRQAASPVQAMLRRERPLRRSEQVLWEAPATGSARTARQTSAAAGRYRFQLAPGRYLVSAPLSADPGAVITLRAGETVTVDFPNHCG